MIGRARHLHDACLFECYVSARAGEPLDPRKAEHLASCALCTARYVELTVFMDELAAQAEVDTDAVFPPERLHMQHQQIARRLEQVGRAARVISFPRSCAGDRLHAAPRRAHDPLRWRVGATAAGLLIGVSLGLGIKWERGAQPGHSAVATAYSSASEHLVPALPVATNGTTLAPMTANDESFLSDLDVALDRPRFGGELQTFDALTPHVREIRNVR